MWVSEAVSLSNTMTHERLFHLCMMRCRKASIDTETEMMLHVLYRTRGVVVGRTSSRYRMRMVEPA